MPLYQGIPIRTETGGFLVLIDGEALDPVYSQGVRNHSPDGFNWGYGGSGPAQCALALLLEETNRQEATAYYQHFKWEVVAHLPQGQSWTLTSEQIQTWLTTRRPPEGSRLSPRKEADQDGASSEGGD